MNESRYVPTADAERAVAQIHRTLAIHLELGGGRRTAAGRLRGTAGVVRADPARYLALPHIVATAEEFCRQRLVGVTEPLIPQQHPALRVMWRRAEAAAEATWDNLAKSWRDWHGIRLSQAPSFAELRAYIEARNSIMHGLGRLTRRQTRDDAGAAVRAKYSSVDISLVGDLIIITDGTVVACSRVARRFVLWLDAQARSLSV